MRASDNFRSPAGTNTVVVRVNVTDVFDHEPTFTSNQSVATIAEGSYLRHEVLRLVALDGDVSAGDVLTYALSSTDGSTASSGLDVNASSGAVVFTGELCNNAAPEAPLPEFSAQVTVTDRVGQQDVALITVRIANVNLHAPQQSTTTSLLNLQENSINGHPIANVSARDDDCGDTEYLQYTLVGTDAALFVIPNASVGAVYMARAIDREQRANVSATVQISDQHAGVVTPRSSLVNFTFFITDVNDVAPAFAQDEYGVVMSEATRAGQSVLTLRGNDGDATAPNNEMLFSMSDIPSNANFRLDVSGSTVELVLSDSFCLRSNLSVRFPINVTDRGTPPLRGSTFVNITVYDDNLHNPAFSSTLYQAAVLENTTMGTAVLTLNATDEDCGDVDGLRYAIIAQSVADAFVVRIFVCCMSEGCLRGRPF